MVHPLLVPPEALEPTGADALGAARKAGIWTAEGVTLTSLLALTVAVTAALTFTLAPVIVPCTALVTYGFWRFGRRITKPGAMVLYCLMAAPCAGAINALLSFLVWAIFGTDGHPPGFGGYLLGIAAVGAVIGIVYGIAYLTPMLIQVSAHSLRQPEAVDRCLVGHGLWGLLVLGPGLGLLGAFPDIEALMHESVLVIAGASFVLHASMLLIGTASWVRRRAWLGRVLQGDVPGWLVCDPERFSAAELASLTLFCNPAFERPSVEELRVLARGDGADAYRSTPLTPKFLVCQTR